MANKPKVSLTAIVEAFETQDDQSFSYINVNNGDIEIIFEDFLMSLDEVDTDMPEWQIEEVKRCRRIISDDDWIELPSQFEINEYQIMQAFADKRTDSDENQKLQAALSGKQAFRRFKDTAFDIGVIDEWYKFRTEAFTEMGRDWCENMGLRYA